MTKHCPMRKLVATTVALAGLVFGLGGQASAAPLMTVKAQPSHLGPLGGTVTVVGRMFKTFNPATATCQVTLLSMQSFPVVLDQNARSCVNFAPKITIGANPTLGKRVVVFKLIVTNGKYILTGKFDVSLGKPS